MLQDSLLSGVASLLSILLVRWLSDPISGFTFLVLTWIAIAIAATVAGVFVSGSHKVMRRWATLSSSWKVLQAVLFKEAVLILVLAAGLVRLPSSALAVLAILSDAFFSGLLIFYIRFTARVFSSNEVSRVKKESARKNALVFGTDDASVVLARELSAEYNVVGFLTDNQHLAGRVIADIVVFYADCQEKLDRLEWRLGGIDCVFFPRTKSVDIRSMFGNKDGKEDNAVIPDGMSVSGQILKRTLDMVVSFALMLLFWPLALVSAIAVKLEDGGPVLYKQERIGKDGRPFYILKVRSMRTDAEKAGAQLYSGEKDPRLTRVGAFLRAHHLAELPQLWNVFRGDMSFIGYRPERQVFINKIMKMNPRYRYLYQIRPGITSYATLYNGYTDTLEKMLTRLDLDLYYLRNHSMLFDARVLGLTFLSIIIGKKF